MRNFFQFEKHLLFSLEKNMFVSEEELQAFLLTLPPSPFVDWTNEAFVRLVFVDLGDGMYNQPNETVSEHTRGYFTEESLEEHFPVTWAKCKEDYAEDHRNVTREDIVWLMNQGDSVNLPGFGEGVRNIAGRAIGLPRTTTGEEYASYFNLKKMGDLYWYFKRDRGQAKTREFEQRYPDEDLEYPEDDEEGDRRWGVRKGEIAAVRFLVVKSRSAAHDFFPSLD